VTADAVSAVPDLRNVPLAALSALRPVALERALGRVVPASGTDPVDVAAFSSAI
jgi:FXSXX-COOH protein